MARMAPKIGAGDAPSGCRMLQCTFQCSLGGEPWAVNQDMSLI